MSPSPAEAARERAIAELVRVSPVVASLGTHFAAAGHEISLVGGSVRDALLGRLGNDLDFTTSAHPDEVERLLTGHVDALWDIGKAFGTIGCRVGQFTCEITTYRSEEYDPDSRKPVVAYGTSLDGDLGRRDFTVNAMAVGCPTCGSSTRSTGSTTWPRGSCARRVVRRTRSTTTHSGCCGPPGSPRS